MSPSAGPGADGDGVATGFMLDGRITMLWASGTNLDELKRHDICDHTEGGLIEA